MTIREHAEPVQVTRTGSACLGHRAAHRWMTGVALALVFVLFAPFATLAAEPPAESFRRALDAYFNEQPYRAIVLLRDTMTRPDARFLREPSLYVLGKSFAAIHLYEKSEDSLRAIVSEFPNGRFAPLALRELARIFFDLREYGAVVHTEQSHRGVLPESQIPAEFWYLVGQSEYLLDRKEPARVPLSKVAPGTPFWGYGRFTLAQVEFATGRPDRALAHMAEVVSAPGSPGLLREKAMRATGMILYEQKRYGESVRAYQTIDDESPLFGLTRIDLALAAEAAGDAEAVGEALSEAVRSADDELVRAEAEVAFGRLFNRKGKGETARTLFDKALGDLRGREGRLRSAIESPTDFREVFVELVAFARQNKLSVRRQRLNEDLEILRGALAGTAGLSYEHAPIPEVTKVSPKTYLFGFLQRHFHNPAVIEMFIELTVELEDSKRETEKLAEDIRGFNSSFRATPPLAQGRLPKDLQDHLKSFAWLILADFDLTSRFFDSLAVSEQMESTAAIREKQTGLARTIESLRLLQFGERALPSASGLEAEMARAEQLITSGKLPGMMSQKVREAFLQELKNDRDSVSYVMENLGLKERQMAGALAGVGLRARNLNLPVLTTMSEWLSALQQLSTKYENIELDRDQRPWHLAARGGDIASILSRSAAGFDELRSRAVVVLREQARELVQKEQARQSLIMAQAEEGIADALFVERRGR